MTSIQYGVSVPEGHVWNASACPSTEGDEYPDYVGLVRWAARYAKETPDDEIAWWPFVNFKRQPACTIGPVGDKIGPQSSPVHRTTTPEQWTRTMLLHHASGLRRIWEIHNSPDFRLPGDPLRRLSVHDLELADYILMEINFPVLLFQLYDYHGLVWRTEKSPKQEAQVSGRTRRAQVLGANSAEGQLLTVAAAPVLAMSGFD